MNTDRSTTSERSARRRAAMLARGPRASVLGPAGDERLARRRAKRRAQGLRLRTFWLPDLSSSAFQEQARRDCEYLWRSVPDDVEAMAFAEAMTDEVLADLDQAESGR